MRRSAVRIGERGLVDGEELIGGGDDSRNATKIGEPQWWFRGGFEPFFRQSMANWLLLLLGVRWSMLSDPNGGGCIRIGAGKQTPAAWIVAYAAVVSISGFFLNNEAKRKKTKRRK